MSKRRIMRTLTLKEIAMVDLPAQEGAQSLLLKRAPLILASVAKSAAPPKENGMDPLKEAEKRIAALEAENSILKAAAALPEQHRLHFASLCDADRSGFIAKSAVARQQEVDASVVYKAADGTIYRSWDDQRMVTMAKQRDADAVVIASQTQRLEDAEFSKRANTELVNLPGEEVAKVAILRAVEGIKDADVKKKALEVLKAHNESFKDVTKKNGAGDGQVEKTNDKQSALDELDKLAKAEAARTSTSYAKAYTEVLRTPEGKQLYNKSLQSN